MASGPAPEEQPMQNHTMLTLLFCLWLCGTPAAGQQVPSFRNEVMPVLSRAGCALGTCHGNQNGKGGFRLSLRGQHPDQDLVTLTRSLGSRRVNLLKPRNSLLLRKPLMDVPHEGGKRFDQTSTEYQVLLAWIAMGMPADSESVPSLIGLNVSPDSATLSGSDRQQVLEVIAEFSDGSSRAINHLAVFESSNPAVVVSPDGIVKFSKSEFTQQTSITVRYQHLQVVSTVDHVPERDGFRFRSPQPDNEIDRLVFSQLQRLRINPSELCDDTVFMRRLYLDLTGRLPAPEQARRFLDSDDPDRRARLIDELLDSTDFADVQTMRWADLLRVEDKTLDAKGVQVFYHWIREQVSSDRPLNEFAAELIAARGSTYAAPPANFYRALRKPEERAEATAQVFLGIRLQCARCHNHPFDRWTQDDYYGWTGFFSRVDYKILENRRRDSNDKHEFDGEQIVFLKEDGEATNPTTGQIAALRFLGNEQPRMTSAIDDSNRDRLLILADWLADPTNERFAASQANRIWFQLFGRGIVDPVDDFRSTNPAVNPPLLKLITERFIAGGMRVRPLMRLILNSAVWQLASDENETNRFDQTLFSHAIPRRLSAEQMVDSISQVVGASPAFGGQPEGLRAAQLPGVRNGGHRYSTPEIGDRFLKLFGKPGRLQTCECERSSETTLAQTMELVSGEMLSELLRQQTNRLSSLAVSEADHRQLIEELWWSALTRAPAEAELDSMLTHLQSSTDRRQALEDIVWALLNSNEFLIRR